MTTPKRCPTCKSTDRITLLRHPIEGYIKWGCWSCVRKTFPVGSTVARFVHKITPGRSEWLMTISNERDLEEFEAIGNWAQTQGKNIVSLYMYTNWRKKTNAGPSSFSFGHEHSLEHLEGRIEWLRSKLPALSGQFTRISADVYQAILDF